MTKKALYYAINVDFDIMIDEGATLLEASDWFFTKYAEDAYDGEDMTSVLQVVEQVYNERIKQEI